ncbi:hydrolase 1, exosortase A system-associated [Herbaspirillum seropedicae]|uniref:hydrolase 1, exosortase A system-associated n=1 Tax=Herbaspirillum seropedicae TaxID=964 RepID=UPI00285D2BF0|nr:hydrolase 1, exosortase A system-associated [Herbaspirillum seropedicae]MDR6393856.1 exosortase A-associated hydrolase 1 [Herbaspirillum seropedicae]
MAYEERVCPLQCQGQQLMGILTLPETALSQATMRRPGILMLVGGAQYRAGSHRQFTLLARHFAAAGFTVLRMDFRGMGDSQGEAAGFEGVAADIDCALDGLLQAQHGLDGVVLWGLCDGASAALLHASADARVRAMVLVNPWARTEAGQAQAYLKHYYRARLTSPDLWNKILRGQFNAVAALRSLLGQWRRAASPPAATPELLPIRLQQAYERFRGPVLLILSGADLTAREFADLATPGSRWEALLLASRTTRIDLPEANHTFSTRLWREQLAQACLRWLTRLER